MIFAIMAGFAMTGAWALDKPKDDGINLDIIQEMPPLNDNAPAGSQADDVNPLDRDFAVALEAYRERDYTTARRMWSELSDAGHGISMHNLAVLKWRGQGGPKERAAALELFKNAGAADVGPSLHALGVLSLKGAGGMARNPAEAVRYFEAASAAGHAPSTYNLALAHLKDIGGASDKVLGMELLQAAAEAGLVRAEYDLATLLYQGTFAKADKAAARGWFERAADHGDPFAYYNLALMQLAGEGGDKDAELAVINLTEAAEMGAVPAQVRLAHMLAGGAEGANKDPAAAYTWFAVAGALGAEGALENARRVAKALDAQALKRAKKAAAAFKPKAPVVRDTSAPDPGGGPSPANTDDLLKSLQQ